MLVNAHDFPGPTLFQGLGLIGAAVWALWLSRSSADVHIRKPEGKDYFQRVYEEHQANRSATAPLEQQEKP